MKLEMYVHKHINFHQTKFIRQWLCSLMFGCLASTTALTTKATTNSLTSLLKNQNPFSINNFSPINEDSLVIVFFYFVSGDSSILEKTHTNCRGKPSKTFKRKSPKETQRTCSEECKKNPLTSRKHSFSLRIFHIFPTSFHQFISQKRQSLSDVTSILWVCELQMILLR